MPIFYMLITNKNETLEISQAKKKAVFIWLVSKIDFFKKILICKKNAIHSLLISLTKKNSNRVRVLFCIV